MRLKRSEIAGLVFVAFRKNTQRTARYKRAFALVLVLGFFPLCCSSKEPAKPAEQIADVRVLLIPLDDRPPCVQFPQMIGRIGDTEVIAPPREMLGRFVEPGQPEEITRWVRSQSLRSFDAIIVSMDMLAYGGVGHSRVDNTADKEELNPLQVVTWMHRAAPKVPIYGFSVIMRLAPTGDGQNEAYRAKLARWAEKSPDSAADAVLKEEVARLEQEIPAAALADYKAARARNFKVNQASVQMVRNGVLDYLILSQDDAQPRGLHVADRERLLEEIRHNQLEGKVAVQPGADEVAMLLLARALNKRFQYSPRIAAIYSSGAMRNRVAPYEDRPLHETVSLHITSTGSREVADTSQADIVFFVYGSRTEPGVAATFSEQIDKELSATIHQVIVADIDSRGDVQGAATGFTEELRKRSVFPRLAGYASWNTAGNTIGTALPHGLVYSRALRDIKTTPPACRGRVAASQIRFLLHRLFDDYGFHSVVRPAAKQFAAENHLNPNALSGESQLRVTTFIVDRMHTLVDELWNEFASAKNVSNTVFSIWGVALEEVSAFTFTLPWGRTFEAAIDFSTSVVRNPAWSKAPAIGGVKAGIRP